MTALGLHEVAITSCQNDPAINAYVWDVHTGTALTTYRGDAGIPAAGLSLLSAQYVLAALQDKPFLRVWPVNSQLPVSGLRLVCPGRVSHALTSPDSCYVALTVAEKLHVYQLASGRLVGTGVRHFQPIRVLQWSADGNFVVCGGEDGLVTVWLLSSLAAYQTAPEPRNVFSDHSLPVTDLTVTTGTRPRLLSVSADRSCKIYDMVQGALLLSVVFDKVLTAVAVSSLETDVFVGTDSGAILQFSLTSPPRTLEYHIGAEKGASVFLGHSKAVHCLSASVNGDSLLSGSADGTVKLWHIGSHQCLRTITHKGPVTNAFFTRKPTQMFENELKPSVVINAFQTANSEKSDNVEIITRQSLSLSCTSVLSEELFPRQTDDTSSGRIKTLQAEIDSLKSINANLYKFAVNKIIEDDSLKPKFGGMQNKPFQKNKEKKKFVKGGNVSNKSIVVAANGTSKSKKRNRNRKKAKLQD